MTTAIAQHFEGLRSRFPADSAVLLTDSQQSFETMEWFARRERPSQACCALFEIFGVPYIVWQMDETGDEFAIFATAYMVHIGRLRLSTKPSGILIIAGFYIDLALLAANIAQHFQAVEKQQAEAGPASTKKRKILLFGFNESFGHHFWNEVSGLTSAMESGIFDTVDGVIVGPFDYFNLGHLIRAKGKQVWKLNSIGSMVTPDLLVAYHSNVITQEARRLVIANAAAQEHVPPTEPTSLHICFQIRRHRRVWIGEENKLVEIIGTCAHAWPDAVFTIDGHSTSKGIVPVKDHEIAEEKAFVARLAARLGPAIDLRSTIGVDVNMKINLLQNVDLFVGPIGSGGVLSDWLLRKPSICYGPSSTYGLVHTQEEIVPEGGGMCHLVPQTCITDMHDEAQSFDVDADVIMNMIRDLVEKRENMVNANTKFA